MFPPKGHVIERGPNDLVLTLQGDDGCCDGSSDDSTSDSDASCAGRDEVIRDADDYITTKTIIRLSNWDCHL